MESRERKKELLDWRDEIGITVWKGGEAEK
jgi:hypothetical protein